MNEQKLSTRTVVFNVLLAILVAYLLALNTLREFLGGVRQGAPLDELLVKTVVPLVVTTIILVVWHAIRRLKTLRVTLEVLLLIQILLLPVSLSNAQGNNALAAVEAPNLFAIEPLPEGWRLFSEKQKGWRGHDDFTRVYSSDKGEALTVLVLELPRGFVPDAAHYGQVERMFLKNATAVIHAGPTTFKGAPAHQMHYKMKAMGLEVTVYTLVVFHRGRSVLATTNVPDDYDTEASGPPEIIERLVLK